MKTSVPGIFAASALLAMALSACGGPAAPTAKEASSTGSGAAETIAAAATPTPTPTPTPTARTYTADELAAIVGQLRDSADRRLSVLGSAELSRSLELAKASIGSMHVSPAECQAMADSGNMTSLDGVPLAAGQSIDTATGSMSMMTLAASLDASALAGIVQQTHQLDRCSTMTMTASGVDYTVTLKPLEGAGSVPGTVAYRTDTKASNGKEQSTIKAQAVHHGVLMTAVAMGGGSEAEAVRRAGALMDAAAALIK